MKKYITLFTFVCVFFFGINSATAQETPEVKAKAKTLELVKMLELSEAQVKQVFAIYLKYETDRLEQGASIAEVRKQINQLLLPAQQQEFKASYHQELVREKKMKKGSTVVDEQ